MEAYFIIAKAEGELKKFKLANGEFVIIGRSPESAQVVIDDDLCSSKHCKVTMLNNAVTIEDLNSKNGIFLNGIRIIKQNFYLCDKIKIGNHLLYIHEDKLGIIDRKLLTYPNSQEKRNFDLTLEIERPKTSNHIKGRKKIPQSSKAQRTNSSDESDSSSKKGRLILYGAAIFVVITVIGILMLE